MDEDTLLARLRQQHMEAKREFCQAHKAGMEALGRRDFQALAQAIAAEFHAIEKQKAATERLEKEIPLRQQNQGR